MHSTKAPPPKAFILFVRFPLLLSTVLLLGMGIFSKRGFIDWFRMHRQNAELESKISLIQEQKEDLDRQIVSFETKPTEQEYVVRQVLGYIKPNETVIELEQN